MQLIVTMQDRNQIVREYFQLRVFLNRANLAANQQTDLKFIITQTDSDRLELLATAKANQHSAKLVLAVKNKPGVWEAGGFSKFRVFENFCCENLNISKASDLTVIEKNLNDALRSLGLK